MKTSLEHKTIRPGSLSDYSFYYSNRRPAATESVKKPPRQLPGIKLVAFVLLIGAAFAGYHFTKAGTGGQPVPVITDHNAAAAQNNECAGNRLDKLIKVSISRRKLWACTGSRTVYSSAVITGMEQHASTATPPGTYHIYAKQQNTVLTGSDETGSWRDPVSYWMPFLTNQYGTYGFHDATWRDPGQFGKVDPNSDQASHGCVELPLATSQWLYNWSAVGTTLTIAA